MAISPLKFLLIQPPVQDFYDTDVRLQPIGLAYIKSTLQRHHPDVHVKILDFHQGHGRFPVPIPPELAYLKSYYPYPDKSPFRSFYQYFHFGASFETIAERILQEKPDVVGISSLFTPYFREALEVARVTKRLFPECPIVFGGNHVNACPENVLACPEVDYIIRGEGERASAEFLSFLKGERTIQEVCNLGYKVNGEPHFNPLAENYPIDSLPFPDLCDLEKDNYRYGQKAMTFLVTSRSCPHRCSFCSVHQTFGTVYRKRTVQDVLAEIQLRYNQGYRIIDFEDDNLTFYKSQMKELCREIIRCFPNRDLEFVAMNGISYISLDRELLHLMKEAGFTHLNLALVTSDRFVREATKRPHTIDKYLEVVSQAKALNFKIVSYQILGLPGESLNSMIQTLRFGAQLPILLGASMFYLTPNSPIARAFPTRNTEEQFLARLTSMHIETKEFCRDDIYTLFITTRILNFLKSFVLDKETDLQTLLTSPTHEPAKQRGLRLLCRLIEERTLFADLGKMDRPLTHFRYSLFARVLTELKFLRPIKGESIRMEFDAGRTEAQLIKEHHEF